MYKPRRPQASPLFRLVQDHFGTLQTVYDDRFAPTYGEWRPVVREVTEEFLACGILATDMTATAIDANPSGQSG